MTMNEVMPMTGIMISTIKLEMNAREQITVQKEMMAMKLKIKML